MDNAQGGHELLHLHTNKVVKRRQLTKIPITPSNINQVHALAILDGMAEGLKIKIKPIMLFSILLGLQEWIMMKKSSMMILTRTKKLSLIHI